MPDTTPAATIRRAAALMRQHALAAIDAGWIEPTSIEGEYNGTGYCIGAGRRVYNPDDVDGWTPTRYIADLEAVAFGEHIAGMHPGVALAVADMLDGIADRHHLCAGAGWSCSEVAGALHVARACLGEPDGEVGDAITASQRGFSEDTRVLLYQKRAKYTAKAADRRQRAERAAAEGRPEEHETLTRHVDAFAARAADFDLLWRITRGTVAIVGVDVVPHEAEIARAHDAIDAAPAEDGDRA